MAEDLHDHSRCDPLGQEEAGRRVPTVVQAVVLDTRPLLELGELPGDLAAVQRRPGGRAEDEVIGFPGLGATPLEQLAVPVGDELFRRTPGAR